MLLTQMESASTFKPEAVSPPKQVQQVQQVQLKEKFASADVVILYRISSGGYPKTKPSYITKEACFKNALNVAEEFSDANKGKNLFFQVIADNCTAELWSLVEAELTSSALEEAAVGSIRTPLGNGAASFRLALQIACQACKPSAIVYMLEDDYVHETNRKSLERIFGGL